MVRPAFSYCSTYALLEFRNVPTQSVKCVSSILDGLYLRRYSFKPSAINSTTSLTTISWPGVSGSSTDSPAPASSLTCFDASVIIVRQKGHPTATVLAPVAAASLNRLMLTASSPGSSSFHICAPPAPQQKDCLPWHVRHLDRVARRLQAMRVHLSASCTTPLL